MEVVEFDGNRELRRLDWRGLTAAGVKIVFGAVLLWSVARQCRSMLLAGWVGMVGLAFVLHFGLFHAAAEVWRARGLNVNPVMCWPVAARSVGEFWGQRWNRPFSELAVRASLRPLARRYGVAVATISTFFASGLAHELVISFPARGGWGLPTGYFVVQGLAMLAERRWNLCGRYWTIAVVAGPVFWLFHPAFVLGVMIPFFAAVGAVPATPDIVPP
jgi:hypothetical protein